MQSQDKDPNVVFLLELVGGFLGFLGLGYFYVGRTNDGLIRLIGWFAYTIIAWVVIAFTSAFIVGCICIPFQLVLQFGVPIYSAYMLKNSLEAEYSL